MYNELNETHLVFLYLCNIIANDQFGQDFKTYKEKKNQNGRVWDLNVNTH